MENIALGATLLGGLVALTSIFLFVWKIIKQLELYIRFLKLKKSKYIESNENIVLIEGSLNKFSDGISLKYIKSSYKNSPQYIQVCYQQNQLKLKAFFSDKESIYLPHKLDVGYESDGEVYWEKNENEYILALADITDDGSYEVLFIVVDKQPDIGFQLQINIFQFHPPANRNDRMRKENWSLIGNLIANGINVPPIIEIEKRLVRVKLNYHGCSNEWHYVRGKFIDKGDCRD